MVANGAIGDQHDEIHRNTGNPIFVARGMRFDSCYGGYPAYATRRAHEHGRPETRATHTHAAKASAGRIIHHALRGLRSDSIWAIREFRPGRNRKKGRRF